MPIINIEIMKTIDERQMQKTIKEKQTKTKRAIPLISQRQKLWWKGI